MVSEIQNLLHRVKSLREKVQHHPSFTDALIAAEQMLFDMNETFKGLEDEIYAAEQIVSRVENGR